MVEPSSRWSRLGEFVKKSLSIGSEPGERSTTVAQLLLRLAIVIYCIGLTMQVFMMLQTNFHNYLFIEHDVLPFVDHDALPMVEHYREWLTYDFTDTQARLIERTAVVFFLLAGVVALIRPSWPILVFISSYIFIEAYTGYYMSGYAYSDYSLSSQMLRYGVPLVLIGMLAYRWAGVHARAWQTYPEDSWRARFGLPMLGALRASALPTANIMLRIAIASVFVIHGYMAWDGHPAFVDLIIGTVRNHAPEGMAGLVPSQGTAEGMMKVIAVVDFAVAAWILLLPTRAVLMWAAFWGFVTAFSRVTRNATDWGYYAQWYPYIEVFFRASHVLGPLALMALIYHPRQWIWLPWGRKRDQTQAVESQAIDDSLSPGPLPEGVGSGGSERF